MAGLTFKVRLRSLMRQDPRYCMVGRKPEMQKLLKFRLSCYHRTFSIVNIAHTNDAVEFLIIRFGRYMGGVEPYLVLQ